MKKDIDTIIKNTKNKTKNNRKNFIKQKTLYNTKHYTIENTEERGEEGKGGGGEGREGEGVIFSLIILFVLWVIKIIVVEFLGIEKGVGGGGVGGFCWAKGNSIVK